MTEQKYTDIIESFNKDGFAIIKGLFSVDEINSLRRNVEKQFEIDKAKGLTFSIPNSSASYIKGDLLSKELLGSIILEDRILNVAKALLGDKLVYFGDSSYQVGTGLRGFHRDNVDRVFNVGQDWEQDYSLIRMGLYLQDHKRYSGGLKVKKGSNKNKSGKSILLDIEEGDLVFWDLRALHSGNAVRLKILPSLPVDYFEKKIPSFLKIDEKKIRMAFFFTFGLADKHLERYIKNYIFNTANMLDSLKNSLISQERFKEIENKKLTIVKPIPEYGN